MAVRIGPTIAIDGMSSYKKDIQTLISKGKALDSEMNVVKSTWDENTTAQQKNADKAKVLSEQIANQRQLVAQLTAVVEKASQSESVNEDQLAKWSTQLNNATADLNSMQGELNGIENGIDDVSEAESEAGDNALSFGDILKANVIADFIVDGVKKLASAMWSAAKGVAQAYVDTVDWADDLLTLSTNTGIATDKLQALEYMAGLTDTDVGDITGALKKMIPKMSEAAKKTDKADDAFSQLGVSVTDANGDLRDNYDVFLDTIDALGKVSNETERDALSMEIFGKNAQELNSLIAVGSDGIEEFAQEAKDLGYILDEETLGSLGEMKDVSDRLNGAIDTIKKQGAAAFTPLIETLANEAIPKIQEYVGEIGKLFSGEISLEDFIGAIEKDIVNASPQFGEVAENLASGLIEAIKQAPGIIRTGAEIIRTICEALSGDAEANGEELGTAVGDIIQALADGFEILAGPVSELAVAFCSAFCEAIIANLPEILGNTLAGIFKGLGHLFETFSVNDAFTDIANEDAAIISGEAFAGAFGQGIEKGKDADVKPAVEEAADAVQEPIETVAEDAETWGEDAGQGFADGLRSKLGVIQSAANDAADAVRGPLHFSRPDYGPLRDYETWMPDFVSGMAQGIRDNAWKLKEAVGALAGDVNVAMNGGGGSTVNLTVTNPSEAYTEYLFEKFNVRLAGVVG